MASASTALDAFDAAFAAAQLAEEEFLVSRELEEISSRRPPTQDHHHPQLPPAHHHQPHFSPAAAAFYNRAGGAGCDVCGRGGGFNSPVTTAPLAASGARGSGGLITAAAPSWCLYCGCSQPLPPNGQCSSCSPHRRAVQTLQRNAPSSEPHRRGYYEAEDAAYPDASARHRSGQYYSPPGTSYTIVEARPSARDLPLREIGFRPINARAASQSPPVRNPRSKQPHNPTHGASISPEQVIRMLNSNHLPAGKQHGRGHVNDPLPPINIMNNKPVRTVSMSRPAESAHGFGICVKGGRESGVGVYISRVEENSVAEHVGLRPGDSILEVNGMPFGGVSHDEALKMLKTCRKVTMTVRSHGNPTSYPALQPPNSTAAASAGAGQLYTWTDRHGRPVSPPPEYAAALSGPPPLPPPQPASSIRTWNFHSARSKERTRKVELSIEPGQSLGLMIRGGIEYGLGVFVTGVDPGSVAERCGLVVGDQILEVNGQSFMAVTHDEAVSQLKYHKRMSLIVRDVGKVPSSGAAPPHTSSLAHGHAWETHLPHTSRSPAGWQRGSHDPGASAALQMVQEKARVLLPHPEFASLDYYQREYAARQMDVEAFVAVLLEMLNTPEKYTLLTELREVVRPEDRARFDELVYRREAEGQRCRELRDLLGHRGGQEHLRDYRGNGSRRHSSPGVDQDGEGGGDGGANRSQYDANDLAQKLSRSFDMSGEGDQQSLLMDGEGSAAPRRRQSMQRLTARGMPTCGDLQEVNEDGMGAMVVPDMQGNLRITVKKCKPMLGIAIEGGANTKHPLPRIINIHENGAAYEAGGLEVGQLILEVDGHKVEGMHHQEVARLIAESFAARGRPEIEFLVVEAKKSNLEAKPTALIFLEA
ncbi:whirlin isoform X6 [Neocloeon triangulifer]|uniref:whirlin isoform X6 n=1 Tax=Neocloeon triangulifer TaxID=2078957 RepID=UPI00286EF05E|nr:whirlin isoform X6 [Neocloeon triangulifer]